jgi:LysR family transcriptional regulator, regulator for metE and metH
MVLTPVGEQLTQIAHEVLSQVGTFERQALDGDFSVTRGTVRVATECYTAYHWLPSVLRGFRDRWPNVELRVAPEHTASPIAALRDGTLDLAVVYRQPADRRIRCEPLFDDELVLVVPPDHRFAGKAHVPVKVLEDEHLFMYTSLAKGGSAVQDILDSADVKPLKTTRVQLTEAILELVGAGFGVAILARWAVLAAAKSGSVQTVRLGKNGCSRTWYTAVRSGDVTPAYQLDLVELLRRHLVGGPATKNARPRHV